MRKGPWGFRGEEGQLQDNAKGRCSVIRSLPCPTDSSYRVISNNSYYGQRSKFKFFKGEVKFSHEPAASRLPLAQNNLHAEVAYLGDACSEPHHSPMDRSGGG